MDKTVNSHTSKMTLEQYKKAMAELGVDRAALATGMPAADMASVTATKGPAYITPLGWKLSMKPIPPPDINEDLSYMNPPRHGKRGGRPAKKR